MKVFVSWSGEKSRDVARVFRDWLPSVLHAVKPFVSARDIRAGMRWQAEIAEELNDTEFGLICVTKENQSAKWLNFEAGALAKSVESSRVVPLAIDLAPADIANPLGQFQAIRPVEDDISDLLTSMNEVCSTPISEENLRKTMEKWWPDLERGLAKISGREYEDVDAAAAPVRSERDLLEEVLDSVRSFARSSPVATKRSESERVHDGMGELIVAEGHAIWGLREKGSGRYIVAIPHPPTSSLERRTEGLEHRLGVSIGFEPISTWNAEAENGG